VGIDLVFPTAPHRIVPADAANPYGLESFDVPGDDDWQFWSWGFEDEQTRTMRGLDESLEFIGKIMREEVPPHHSPPANHFLLVLRW
jgi:hypothetical protein